MNNIKIKIINDKHSSMIQQQLFSTGYQWGGDNDTTVHNFNEEWIFADINTKFNEKHITYSDNYNYGKKHRNVEVRILLEKQREFLNKLDYNKVQGYDLNFVDSALTSGFYPIKNADFYNGLIELAK